MSEILQYLEALDPAALNYTEWVQCGMALKEEGYPVSVWDHWSARDPARYKEGECSRKWETFHKSGDIVTGGTIFQICRDKGLLAKADFMDWDDTFIADSGADPVAWHPGQEIRQYLEALFDPSEIVNIVTRSFQDKDGKYKPRGYGHNFKVSTLLAGLKEYGDDIGAAIGDYDKAAGAWIRFNPMDGKGIKNENVADYRFALVESDTLSISEQGDLIRKLNLPVAALVHSGGKSLHAIVRIDAEDRKTYDARVKELYAVCKENGFVIDEQNKNPSRLSRLPGCERNGKRQRLIKTNTGASWESWKGQGAGKPEDKPPQLKPMSAADLDALELPPIKWIVEDILPEGVAILSAPPKSYKSFMMLDLCIEVCKGGQFMEHMCSKVHALYLDLESGKRRPRERMRRVLNGEPPPDGLYYLTGEDDVRRIGQGFEEQICGLLEQDSKLKLIIIDVLKMIRPEAKRGQLSYDADYELITPLNKIVHKFPGLCIVAVTHDRKMRDTADWINNLSGSTGLTGAVDVIMRIDKDNRGCEESTLQVTGRDVEPQALQMKFDKDAMRWQCLGTREEVAKQRFNDDYANSGVIQTIRKAFSIFGKTYEATIPDLIEWSGYWNTSIYGKTSDAIGKEISKYKNLLEMDGITYRPGRKGKKRSYIFSETDFDLDEAIENLEQLPSVKSV